MRRGGVVRRGSTWGYRAEISLPGAPRKQVRKSGFRTQAEAARALNLFLTEADQGAAVPNSRISVQEYLAGWLDARAAQGLRQRTIETYESLIRIHVLPSLGPVRMQALSVAHLDRLYAGLRSRDRTKPLSARTVRIVHTILHRALADAERQGIVPRNVADLASPPSNKAAKAPEAGIWSVEQLESFLDRISDHHLHPMVYLIGYTGLRRGEACGLRWSDVDMDAGRLVVRQQAQNVHGAIAFSDLKTENAHRSVALDGETVAMLRAHKARQAEWRLAIGPGWRDTGLVFTREDGSPFDPGMLTKTFHYLVKRSGLPLINVHGLRHSHASHLLAAGVPALVVSKRLGHSSVTFTQDRYGHLLPDSQDSVVAALGRVRSVSRRVVEGSG